MIAPTAIIAGYLLCRSQAGAGGSDSATSIGDDLKTE
jgi:hypothetical protein